MNRQGRTLFVLSTAVMIILTGLIFLNFIKDDVVTARSVDNLNCGKPNEISDGTKVTCLVADITVPYLFIGIIAVAGGIVAARFAQP